MKTVLNICLILIAFMFGHCSSNIASMSPPPSHTNIKKFHEYGEVQVFFATDRKYIKSTSSSDMFGDERSTITYGDCYVSIPWDHRMGEIESPSILRFEFSEDPVKHVVILSTNIRDKKEYFQSIKNRILHDSLRSAFIFIHGYNVSFEEAAKRTAQMSYDLGFSGAPIFYSWPSYGKTSLYTIDEQNIEWAQSNIRDFLNDFIQKTDAENIYLIAHSMGNRALTKAIISLDERNPSLKKKIKEIILAAPDIDAEVFKKDIAPQLIATGKPVTLYSSSDDIALKASKIIHGYARAGDSGDGLVLFPGIETIDATNVATGLIGHSYIADNSSILSDIFYIIRNHQRANERFGLKRIDQSNGSYWEFKK